MAAKRYALRVTGRWSERFMRAFPGMQIDTIAPQTVIVGEVHDQEQLHHLLALCAALGLQVTSLTSTPLAPSGDEQPSGNEQPTDGRPGRASGSDEGGGQQPVLLSGDDCLPPVAGAELRVDRPDVRLHGVRGDREVLGDLLQ